MPGNLNQNREHQEHRQKERKGALALSAEELGDKLHFHLQKAWVETGIYTLVYFFSQQYKYLILLIFY